MHHNLWFTHSSGGGTSQVPEREAQLEKRPVSIRSRRCAVLSCDVESCDSHVIHVGTVDSTRTIDRGEWIWQIQFLN